MAFPERKSWYFHLVFPLHTTHKNKKPGNPGKNLAVRVGFEPTDVFSVAGFQDQFLKPLGHLSTVATTKVR